MIATTAGG